MGLSLFELQVYKSLDIVHWIATPTLSFYNANDASSVKTNLSFILNTRTTFIFKYLRSFSVHLLFHLNTNVLKCLDNELQNSHYSRHRLTHSAWERLL